MRRRLSSWFLVALTCLGVAIVGLGCERTIDDGDFFNPGPGPDPGPDPNPDFCDTECQLEDR